MVRAAFRRALGKQAARVVAGEGELGQPLQEDDHDQKFSLHRSLRRR